MSNDRLEQLKRAAARAREGQAEKSRKYNETHTYFKISVRKEVYVALREEADQRGVTIPSLVREAIDLYMKTLRKSTKRGGWS